MATTGFDGDHRVREEAVSRACAFRGGGRIAKPTGAKSCEFGERSGQRATTAGDHATSSFPSLIPFNGQRLPSPLRCGLETSARRDRSQPHHRANRVDVFRAGREAEFWVQAETAIPEDAVLASLRQGAFARVIGRGGHANREDVGGVLNHTIPVNALEASRCENGEHRIRRALD